MSTSNFQWRHDGLRWRIKLMQNTPTASLFYCRARDGHDRYLHFSEELEVEVESVEKPKIYFSGKVYCRRELDMITAFFWRIRDSEG